MHNDAYVFILIDEARAELDKEIGYSAKNWGVVHARKYRDALEYEFQVIKHNPYLYALRDDILPGIRIKTCKGNRIIYTIRKEENVIVILAFLSVYQTIDPQKLSKRKKKI